MFEKLKDLPAEIEGVKAVGRVSKEDYERVFSPIVDAARRDGTRLRFLFQIGPEFEGFTPSAAWEDAKLGIRSMSLFDGCAIVTDVVWVRDATQLARFMMPCPVRVFANRDRDAAVEWLRTLPEGAAVSHRLLPEGVIVVDVEQALRAQDFDALAVTADAWIEAHGDLQGLVIHVRAFPGWENLGSLFRHLRFIRKHERKIKRVALAVDSKLAALAPRVVEHFVHAEVKSYAYDQLDDAIAWAKGGSSAQRDDTPSHDRARPIVRP